MFTLRRPTCQEAVRPLRQSGRHLRPPTGGRHLQSVQEQGAGCQGGMRRLPPDDDLVPAPARRHQPLPDLCAQEHSDLLLLRSSTPGERPDLRRAGLRWLLLQPCPPVRCLRADRSHRRPGRRLQAGHLRPVLQTTREDLRHLRKGPPGPPHQRRPGPVPLRHVPPSRKVRMRPVRAGREGQVFWPRGPVCDSCYRTALSTPAPCASCNRQRILIGQTAEGSPLCRACSFPDEPVERCSACDEPADLYSGRCCPRCTLAARVTDLLSADGASVAQPLQPLAAVLTGAEPRPAVATPKPCRSSAGPLGTRSRSAEPQIPRHAAATDCHRLRAWATRHRRHPAATR